MAKTYNVLFLCTGNSARSIMAEALLNRHGKGRFRSFSAGAHPTGTLNPMTVRTLAIAGIAADGLESKGWEGFSGPGTPEMDFIFTVCDNAAGEECPVWPGHPTTAHWGFPDPAVATGTEAERLAAFAEVFRQINRRIELFCALPLDSLDRLAAKHALDGLAGA